MRIQSTESVSENEIIPSVKSKKESPEITPEAIQEAINASTFSRKGVQDIFSKF